MRVVPLLVLLFSAAPAFADCVDYASEPARLVDLEPYASTGALDDDQKSCLEAAYSAATVQTTKSKISRVLLVNAYAYDTSTWVKLVKRHLEEVEQSDPNIAYLYAFWLFNREAPNYDEVLRWTDVALERRTEWKGQTLVSRAYQLYRLRAWAAYEAWSQAEAEQGPNAEELRNKAKTYSREYIDYAREAKKSTLEAEGLCISAASRSACGLD